ncbi:MAG: MarR family winged helix-turn-helix transcriptional regulator, partial [Sedimentibacter sp.]
MRETILKNELWDLVRITSMNLEAAYKPIVESHGLTVMQSRILIAIGENELINIGRISNILEVSSGNASNMCKRLEKEGFIKRIRSTNDERIVELALTNKGIITKEIICDDINKRFKPVIENRSKEEFDTIIIGIKKLNELLTD